MTFGLDDTEGWDVGDPVGELLMLGLELGLSEGADEILGEEDG